MLTHVERMKRFDASDLYVVITEEFCAGRSCLEVLDAVLEAGVTLIQFREKNWDDFKLFTIGEEFRKKTGDAGALLIVNNRVDLALAIEADGVHLGQSDLPVDTVRAIAPSLIIGASTHSLEDARTAQEEGASYYNIGPIYPTNTKALSMDVLGPEAIDAIAPSIDLPFTCMGGIKPGNIGDLLSRGAKHPAVVTAVTEQADITAAAQFLRDQILNR
jgi:thiamine-phosphate pyrophosphorylase